ncbi:ATP-binding cassette sub-family F member 3 [Silurus asotus]|uniref:ATP-binding cassette sub-family F member 3 n=1 Tax=Silurus asotus TaxID=30991 RepID=A0AAD5FT05_SILAS|nr:ATP-binding cassette sub-family F member 3 [Silurus asotus]
MSEVQAPVSPSCNSWGPCARPLIFSAPEKPTRSCRHQGQPEKCRNGACALECQQEPLRNMATYVDILRSEFPDIDTEVFAYITGVLDSGGSDFEDGEEVFDAIGGVLQEVGAEKNEDDVRDICLQLFNTLKINNCNSNQRQVLLDAPVQLSQISAESESAVNDVQGIWMVKRNQGTTVNAKKLEKAEAKLKAKHERRNEKDSQKPSNPLVLEEASASQASSKKENRVDLSGKNRSYDIRIENFDVSFGERRSLLQGAELCLASGRRYGLIGRNGLGKTTLLKMLASRSLRVPAHISILHVEQEVAGDETEALQSVLESDTVREELLREERSLNAHISNGTADGTESVRLSEIYAKLEEIEADKAPARASVILAGLGFSPKMQQQPTKEFSGGWRMRLALARALFARPDLLLLDEPTNMLDVRAILWLETYLQTWQSTILVVSHDRNFLNAVVTDIIHLHSQRLDSYRGDYENFIKTKEDRLKNQQREYEAQLQYREHIQVMADFGFDLRLTASVKQTNLKIGYFSQHHVDQLDLNACSVELLLSKFPGQTEEDYRRQLGRYGISGELAMRPVASLSGGQKSRVAFAQMTMPCPNFYILDEPTNHLDMETIEALAKSLNVFKGGVVLVSHDERLIRLVCKELWVCEAGRVQRIDGGFDEYKNILQEQFRKEGFL